MNLTINKRKNANRPVFYLVGCDEQTHDGIMAQVKNFNVSIKRIATSDWNRQLTPWPAEKVFAKGENFAGEADMYLAEIIEQVKREEVANIPPYRCIIGYSLAGLFCMYAAHQVDMFCGVGSVSGSMWYDGWMAYMAAHPFSTGVRAAYFSIGDAEGKTRNPRMATGPMCTRQAAEIAAVQGVTAVFHQNPGNHFENVEGRIARSVRWLYQTLNQGTEENEKTSANYPL